MEKLPYALRLGASGAGVVPRECHPREPRSGRKVAWKPDRAHSAAVAGELQTFREGILRIPRGKPHVVVEHCHLLLKRGIVRQHSRLVFVYLKPFFGGLHHDTAGSVRDYPVELSGWELFAERSSGEIHAGDKLPSLGKFRALGKYPGDKFELRDVPHAFTRLGVLRVAHEVQPRHAETLLVHGVVVERVAARSVSHSDDRVVIGERSSMPEFKREFPRSYRDLLAV